MLDALKTLFENNVVSEDVRQEIEEAWQAKVKENRQKVTAELREEFAQKYEHDKNVMVEAIDNMISERLESEMAELAEDRKQLIHAKAKYTSAMHENAKLLKSFVTQSLVKEVKELQADQLQAAQKFTKLEEFVIDSLAKEITEFQIDKHDLANTKVRLVREAKIHFDKLKSAFVQKSINKISNVTEKVLTNEIGQLKEDIELARKNDFGRRIFEAFSVEYMNSYLNEKSETSKLVKIIETKNAQLEQAKKNLQKQQTLVENSKKETKIISEKHKRWEIINELTEPLSKSQKSIMLDLLESVQTDRLNTMFNKYLPAVIDEQAPKKKAIITEGKEITGNKQEKEEKTTSASDNVIDIRRLAGLN